MRNICSIITLIVCAVVNAGHAQSIWMPDTTLRLFGRPAFRSIRVIDHRATKENIGFLKTGAFNRYSDLITAEPLATTLEAYMDHYLAGAVSENRLLMVIYDFRAEDRKGNEEIGTMHLRANLFAPYANGYRRLFSRDTIYESKSGWDVTKWVIKMPSEAVIGLTEDASRLAAAAAPQGATSITEESAIAYEEDLRKNIPLYTATAYPRGLYHTMDDLLMLKADSTPLIDERIAHMDEAATTNFYYQNDRGRRGKAVSVNDCFAISDGTKLYISRKDRFTTLVKHDGDFFANLYSKGLTDNSVAMGAAFGLIGTIASTNDHSKHTVLYRCRLVPDELRFVPVARIR